MSQRRMIVLVCVLSAMAAMLSFSPASAALNCHQGTDSTGTGDTIPQNSVTAGVPIIGSDGQSSPARSFLDIVTYKLCGDQSRLHGTITVREGLPTGETLPTTPDETGYSFYWHYQSGLNPSDSASIMHARQKTGLAGNGESNNFRGPYPIGDNFSWSIEVEWRYTPNPTGSDWTPFFTFTILDPSEGLGFTELLPGDNPGLGGSVSADGKTIGLSVPYTIKYRVARSKGTGAAIGGATYLLNSMQIAKPGQTIKNIWASSWANSTASLPPAACAVTNAAGICSIGGIVSQEDQAPNTATILGDYGFVSYVADDNCPVFVNRPFAIDPQGNTQQVNPVAVNPFYLGCYTKLPFSRTYGAPGGSFVG